MRIGARADGVGLRAVVAEEHPPPAAEEAPEAIAAAVKPEELGPEYVIPSVFNRDVAPLVAAAVAAAAEATGVARRHHTTAHA